MESYAIEIKETKKKIVLVSADSLADGILKVQSLYNDNQIKTSDGKTDVQISGLSALPQTIDRLKHDSSVLDLTKETEKEILENLPFDNEL